MLDQVDDASRREKCFTTISQLPDFVDPKQIPSKRSPFSTIQNHAIVHSVGVFGLKYR
jgi:ribonuclease P/MRP protein subunit RPP40